MERQKVKDQTNMDSEKWEVNEGKEGQKSTRRAGR